jgi:hypothetical protein
MCVPPPRHAWGHRRCSRRCATASQRPAKCFYAGKNARQNAWHCGNFSKLKKIQKPKLQSNASVLLLWQHAAWLSSPSTGVKETSSMQGRIAPPLLRWRRAAMRSHSLSHQRTLQHARGDRACIAALARHSSSIWRGEETLQCAKGDAPLLLHWRCAARHSSP